MNQKRTCSFKKDDGRPCGAPPLQDAEHCFTHSPHHAGELDEARRLGGIRRRRERVVSTTYDFEGLESVPDIRRALDIAIIDTLEQPNSLARSRTLGYLVRVALRTYEVGELDERLRALEDAVHRRPRLGKGGRR